MNRKKITFLTLFIAIALAAIFVGMRIIKNKQPESGWHITTYYTAVESYHHNAAQNVYGCPVQQCSQGNTLLGQYPSDFINAVKQEGAGRITSGSHAGKYLNWSYDVGYWLDDIAADTHGNKLEPYVSAAADADVLKQSTRFMIVSCGTSDIDTAVCDKFKSSHFIIRDEFTPGYGGKKHIDVYIGEENQPDFENSQTYTDLSNAAINLGHN